MKNTRKDILFVRSRVLPLVVLLCLVSAGAETKDVPQVSGAESLLGMTGKQWEKAWQERRGDNSVNYYYDAKNQLPVLVNERFLKALTAGDAARDAVRTRKDLEARRREMRKRFLESMGGLPSSDTPLNPRITGTVEYKGFRTENIIFESRPGAFVTANLFLPDSLTSPVGAVLFLCGHSREGRLYPEYLNICHKLVQAGLAVLAVDPAGQGERFSWYDTPEWPGGKTRVGTADHYQVGNQCLPLGDGLARYFVHDAMRAIDYLCTRPEIDPEKIGVTGSSGGGMQTGLLMVCDSRVAAAAPATFLSSERDIFLSGKWQDPEQVWHGMTALGFDHEDILMAMAPKPVRVLACRYDFVPIEGTRRTVDRCRRFWKMYGKEKNLSLVEDDSPHRYTPNLSSSATVFFAEHLLCKKVDPDKFGSEPIDASGLQCTVSGQVNGGEIPGARSVFDENLERLRQIEKERERMPENLRRGRGIKWLGERVSYGRKPCELNPRFYRSEEHGRLKIQACLWRSQERMFNHGFLFRDSSFDGQDLPVTMAVWNGGTSSLKPHAEWVAQTCASGRAVLVLDLSAMGAINPYVSSPSIAEDMYVTHCNFFWLGDSIAAMHVWDVLRAVEMIAVWPGMKKDDIRCYADGQAGVAACLASLLDRRITVVETGKSIASYASWVGDRNYNSRSMNVSVIPGILRYLDLPDIGSVKEIQ